jgi:hypothetical protein
MFSVLRLHVQFQVRQLQAVDRQGPDDVIADPGDRTRRRQRFEKRRPVFGLPSTFQLLHLSAKVRVRPYLHRTFIS